MIKAIIAIATFAATNMAAVNGTTPAKAVKNLAILIDATRATHVLIRTNHQEQKAAPMTPRWVNQGKEINRVRTNGRLSEMARHDGV
jgi:hypothetical protein